ncbi:MAG: class I SAM-dependent methyltransferase [bacterium]
MPEIIVTTTLSEFPGDIELARRFASRLGGEFTGRKDRTLDDLWQTNEVRRVIVVDHGAPVCHTPGGRRLFFHIGLAKTRIKFLQQGGRDYLVESLNLKRGDRILDANLGIANDALVIAFATQAPMVGLEKDPLIAAITEHGLRHHSFERLPEARPLARLIQVVQADNLDFMLSARAKSFDSVYFSPMFVKPSHISSDKMPLREIAPKDFVTDEIVGDARRVARKRVVIKLNRDRPADLPLPEGHRMVGGKKSYVEYAVYEA